MNTWITSDIHYGHQNVLSFCSNSRQFSDLDEMHTVIKDKWNSKINPTDTVYILGDVSFGKLQETVDYINSLNGFKHLIIGNHDKKLMRQELFRSCFNSTQDYLELKYKSNLICLMHYPLFQWNAQHYGSFALYGHLHSRPISLEGRCKDIGMDTNNCEPYLLDDVITELRSIKYSNHRKELVEFFTP